MKHPREVVQVWTYHAFFRGEIQIYAALDVPEEQVRAHIQSTEFGGNWSPESLKQGPKKKAKPDAQILRRL